MAKLKNLANRPQHARRGLALIEMAMVLPLLLMITFAVMEYGWMFVKASQVANAARQGARVGARPNANTASIQTAIAAAMSAGNMANPGSGTPVYTVSVPTDPSTVASGVQFSVTVQLNYPSVGLGLPLIPTPAHLTSTVTMAREGP